MSLEVPDYQDADLVIKLYDLRREPVLRQSRQLIAQKFWPRSIEDLAAVAKPDHELNAPFRQTGSYWEMVYGMARHGIINPDFLVENSGEGLYLFAKVHPFLAALRQMTNPRSFENAEWIAAHSEVGQRIFEGFRARVQKALETR